jgi:hypothetical protein
VPRIFDNMDLTLVSALRENLPVARRVDVSVGYFNLRGWRLIDRFIEALGVKEDTKIRDVGGIPQLVTIDSSGLKVLGVVKDGERHIFGRKLASTGHRTKVRYVSYDGTDL